MEPVTGGDEMRHTHLCFYWVQQDNILYSAALTNASFVVTTILCLFLVLCYCRFVLLPLLCVLILFVQNQEELSSEIHFTNLLLFCALCVWQKCKDLYVLCLIPRSFKNMWSLQLQRKPCCGVATRTHMQYSEEDYITVPWVQMDVRSK